MSEINFNLMSIKKGVYWRKSRTAVPHISLTGFEYEDLFQINGIAMEFWELLFDLKTVEKARRAFEEKYQNEHDEALNEFIEVLYKHNLIG